MPTECSLDFGIAAMLGTLGREAARGGPDCGLYLESLANVLAAHLLRRYGKWKRGGPRPMTMERNAAIQGDAALPQPVQRAMHYIEQHHAQDIGLRDIAQAARCSPYHLARTFKHSVGVPPHKYLIQVRVRSAHSLLSIGREKLSVAEVASASGFSDQSHLTRHFKRMLGVTPRQVIAATGLRRLSS
jgi:AraC family transcriptional regulator